MSVLSFAFSVSAWADGGMGQSGWYKRIRLGGWARNAEKKQIGCKGVFTDGLLGKVVDF